MGFMHKKEGYHVKRVFNLLFIEETQPGWKILCRWSHTHTHTHKNLQRWDSETQMHVISLL